ncbi:MAG: 2,3-dimethylmalate dehydratase small subunit [Actinobacteria bacterium ADurb.Bin444]|nr:MAG: 2,3-dimethylmalate dehydratase small subunit [Actinobacteria bacterium ADurb.Bin444]
MPEMAKVILKLGDDISTDAIYPGRFMATVLPTETPQFAFADYTEFNAKLKSGEVAPGGVIVAAKNFGCGSSREQAASTLKGWDITVVARNYSRIFLQNSINLGLRTVICPDLEAEEGDELEISADKVVNKTSGREFVTEPLPPARQAIVDAGGLIPYARQKLVEMRKAAPAAPAMP